jgi:hypothetical protein
MTGAAHDEYALLLEAPDARHGAVILLKRNALSEGLHVLYFFSEIIAYANTVPLQMTFQTSFNTKTITMPRDFAPNVHPKRILKSGFGKTYFRDIYVPKLRKTVKNAWKFLPKSWRQGLTKDSLARPFNKYDKSFNRFKVKVGASYSYWLAKGWINPKYDTHGWFQWFCRYKMGRRCPDDARQIGRWKRLAGPEGRFRLSLCRLVLKKARGDTKKAIKFLKDDKVYPRMKQTLWHWGTYVTPQMLKQYLKRKKTRVRRR